MTLARHSVLTATSKSKSPVEDSPSLLPAIFLEKYLAVWNYTLFVKCQKSIRSYFLNYLYPRHFHSQSYMYYISFFSTLRVGLFYGRGVTDSVLDLISLLQLSDGPGLEALGLMTSESL